jgi:hypothetical protein
MNNQEDNESVGATWWNEMLTRREANQRLAKLAAMAAIVSAAGISSSGCGSDDDAIVDRDAFDLQKKEGWNVGSDKKLVLADRAGMDSSGSLSWSSYLDASKLLKAYEPKNSEWRKFVVPTLVQSLSQASLRSQLAPIFSPSMRAAYSRGLGMREILTRSKTPEGTMLVIDLPGPESVAFGAALADVADLVQTFDNWPHPLGVVPSHLTLAAMLYYAHEVSQKAAKRPSNAPAVLLLDGNRLAAYSDANEQFDNRYTAKMPTASNLSSANVKSLLYFVPNENHKTESDDLNDDFATYQEKGVSVSLMNATDFKPATSITQSQNGQGQNPQNPPTGSQGTLPPSSISQNSSSPASQDENYYQPSSGYYQSPTAGTTTNIYHYGGSPSLIPWFFFHYPCYYPSPTFYPSYNAGYYRQQTLPSSLSTPTYQAVRRPTMFSSRTTNTASGIGKQRPTGFGRVSTRVDADGHLTSVRSGNSRFFSGGRSGSFGRASGGHSS